jgi:hypothetical protein
MSQPVKISDDLVLDARLTGKTAARSIAGQIEYWAALGRCVEPLLRGREAQALLRAGAARPVSECLDGVDSPAGRKRVADYLDSQPYPHYEPSPDHPGYLTRIDEDGTRTIGRFVRRKFVPKSTRRSKR